MKVTINPSISSISPPHFIPDPISFELFRAFSLPAPQINLELFFRSLRSFVGAEPCLCPLVKQLA